MEREATAAQYLRAQAEGSKESISTKEDKSSVSVVLRNQQEKPVARPYMQQFPQQQSYFNPYVPFISPAHYMQGAYFGQMPTFPFQYPVTPPLHPAMAAGISGGIPQGMPPSTGQGMLQSMQQPLSQGFNPYQGIYPPNLSVPPLDYGSSGLLSQTYQQPGPSMQPFYDRSLIPAAPPPSSET